MSNLKPVILFKAPQRSEMQSSYTYDLSGTLTICLVLVAMIFCWFRH